MTLAKFLSLPAAAAVLALVASSCGNSDGQFYSFKSFSLSAIAESADADSIRSRLPGDFDGRWQVTSSGVMPVKIGPHELTALLDTLSSLTCVNLSSSLPQIQLPPELRSLAGDTVPAGTRDPGSSLQKELTLDLLNTRVAVFRVYSYSYPEGAAHGMYSNSYVNYDVAGGNVVTLPSLFVAGFEHKLRPLILERLHEKVADFIVDEDEIGISRDFRITGDGVEFIYGLYSVAPYAAGEQRVEFGSYELEDILTPAGKALLGLK